jgi:hypothetical protein
MQVNDSAAGLMGDGQEEDRRHIAELVLTSMEVIMCSIDILYI